MEYKDVRITKGIYKVDFNFYTFLKVTKIF